MCTCSGCIEDDLEDEELTNLKFRELMLEWKRNVDTRIKCLEIELENLKLKNPLEKLEQERLVKGLKRPIYRGQ